VAIRLDLCCTQVIFAVLYVALAFLVANIWTNRNTHCCFFFFDKRSTI